MGRARVDLRARTWWHVARMSGEARFAPSARRRRGLGQVAFAAALLVSPAAAFADASGQSLPLVLAYEASSGCPDQASFRDEVGLRLRRPIAWLSDGDARKVTVRI